MSRPLMLIATVTSDVDKTAALIERGFRAFRINFGRRDTQRNLRALSACRDICDQRGFPCNILADLPGQKFRAGRFENTTEAYQKGELLLLQSDATRLGTHRIVTGVSSALLRAVRPRSLLQAGEMRLIVQGVGDDQVTCEVLEGGQLYNSCGFHLLDGEVERRDLTDEDRDVIELVRHAADCICVSFADSADMIEQARHLATAETACPKIIAKIETRIGVERLDSILAAADGAMLARGDLGVFFSKQEMREVGERMLSFARRSEKVILFATDYFASMAGGAESLSEDDQQELSWATGREPDGIVINETSSSPHWMRIAEAALQWPVPAGSRS